MGIQAFCSDKSAEERQNPFILRQTRIISSLWTVMHIHSYRTNNSNRSWNELLSDFNPIEHVWDVLGSSIADEEQLH
ncbi:hypothetical protein TNCV_3732261 [Trichonephila clavipes]|nr:hypothetical protein TNCV_3732261 [Trichonephila clavipes]